MVPTALADATPSFTATTTTTKENLYATIVAFEICAGEDIACILPEQRIRHTTIDADGTVLQPAGGAATVVGGDQPRVQRGRRRAAVLWHFSHCGPGFGDWKIETSGPLTGKGTGSVAPDLKGTWFVDEDNPEQDVKVTYSGNLWLTMKLARGPDDIPVMYQLHLEATQSTVTSGDEVFRTNVNLTGSPSW